MRKFSSDNHQVYITRTTMALGGVQVLQDILDIKYDDIQHLYQERQDYK